MARRGRCAPARSTAKSPTAFAANGAPRSTPISDPSSKPHGEDRSEPSTPSASPSRAAPCLAQLENVNGDLSNYSTRWQKIKFGQCATLINGRAYAQEEPLETGTPVLRMQNLNGGSNWYFSNLDLPNDKYCVKGDLLFAWSASFGPYVWNGPKAIYHYHIWKVIPRDNLDRAFAFHLLDWITQDLKASARGIAMLHLTK